MTVKIELRNIEPEQKLGIRRKGKKKIKMEMKEVSPDVPDYVRKKIKMKKMKKLVIEDGVLKKVLHEKDLAEFYKFKKERKKEDRTAEVVDFMIIQIASRLEEKRKAEREDLKKFWEELGLELKHQ